MSSSESTRTWQNYLVRLVALVALLGTLFITAAFVAVGVNSSVEEDTLKRYAKPVVYTVVGMLLLCIGGVVLERKAMGARLPRPTRGRFALAIVVIGIFAPVLDLSFALGLCATCLVGLCSTASEKIGPQLRRVAVCDALLWVIFAEGLRHAGSWRDRGLAGVTLAHVAFLGVFLPCLLLAASAVRAPRLALAGAVAFAAAAAHAMGVVFLAMSAVLRDAFDGAPPEVSGGDLCFEPPFPSPVGFFLRLLRESKESDSSAPPPAAGGGGLLAMQNDPCARAAAAVVAADGDSEGSAGGFWAVLFFALAGAYVSVLLSVALLAGQSARVVPHSSNESAPADQESNAAPPKTQAEDAVAFAHVKRCSLRLFVLAALVVAAGALALLGVVAMDDGFDRLRSGRRLDDAAGCALTEEAGSFSEEKGFLALFRVPAERFSTTWCVFGPWAPALLGALLYSCHVLAISLLMGLVIDHRDEVRRKKVLEELALRRKRARMSSKSLVEAGLNDDDFGFSTRRMAKKEPLPEPDFRDTDGRVFTV